MISQDTPLVKITPPRISRVVSRERLFRVLDSGGAKPVQWISGPAGSGKTTLVASYLASRKTPCAWYQADERDADIASFFYYLGLAVWKARPRKRTTLPLLTPEYLGGVATFAKRYFETIYSTLKTPSAIVFDNYQEIAPDSPLHDLIQQGAALAPEGITVFIVSRTEPLPAFTRLIANNALHRVTADDLRFTERESREFFGLRSRGSVPPKLAAEIHAQTQGWAAGLVLYAEMAGRAGQGLSAPLKRLPEDVFHYFAGEIFDGTDRETRNFLLRTALFAGFTASMAEQISGLGNADRLLAGLTRKNFFILKRPDPDPIYQYHPLFRDFLLARAKEQLQIAELAKLREDAAQLLDQAGRVDEAVELFRETGNWGQAARLILQSAHELLSQGRLMTLLQWIDSLPQDVTRNSGYLLYFSGACLMLVKPAESRKTLELAYEQFKKENDRAGMFLALCSLVDLCMYEAEDFSRIDHTADRLHAMLKDDPSFPSAEIEVRVTLSIFNALSMRQPGHADLSLWEERAQRFIRLIPDRNVRINARIYHVLSNLWTGNYIRASSVVDAVRKDVEAPEVSPAAALAAMVAIELYAWVTGDCDASLEAMSAGLELAERSGVAMWTILLLENGTAAALSKGDLKRSEELLQRVRANLGQARHLDYVYYLQLEIWNALLRRDTAKAREYLQGLGKESFNIGSSYGLGVTHTFSAMVLFESGQEREAEKRNNDCLALGRDDHNKLLEYMALLFRAHMYFKRAGSGPRDREALERKGREALQEAFAIGRERGIVNIAAWRNDIMANLCVKALEAGIETEFVRHLVRVRGVVPEVSPLGLESWPWRFRIYTLTRFSIVKDGKPLRFVGRVRERPLDLLKALIALGGRDVEVWSLIEALWPEAEGDAAQRSFDTTLFRLRRMLGDDDALALHEGKLTLNNRFVWVDTWAFERLIGMAVAPSPRTGEHREDAASSLRKALALYHRHFLRDVADPWAVAMRERLRSKCLRAVLDLGQYWEDRQEPENAVRAYEQGLVVDDLAEEFYRRIMSIYHHQGRFAEGISVYHRCRRVLRARQGIDPSESIEELHRSFRSAPPSEPV